MDFMIMARFRDPREGEASFTAAELQDTLRDALAALRLDVTEIRVERSENAPSVFLSAYARSCGLPMTFLPQPIPPQSVKPKEAKKA